MSKTIWKYRLPRDGATIEIHEYIVEVLHIAAQDGIPTLWAIVDPDRPRDGYTEVVAWGTGWPLPDDVYQETDYWGSCGDAYGYIWHYFAATRYPERRIWDYEGLTAYPSNIADKISTTGTYVLDSSSSAINTLTTKIADIEIDYNELQRLLSTTYAEGVRVTATNKAYQ